MQGYDDIEIVLFKASGRAYRVSKYREKRGSNGGSRTVFFLNKMLFPTQARIRIRIPSSSAYQLEKLSKSEGMALCEELIAQQFCQGCLEQKSREPPGAKPTAERSDK